MFEHRYNSASDVQHLIHAGSVGFRLSNTGALIDKEEYYPFGDSSLRTCSSKRYRYVGKEKDVESQPKKLYSIKLCSF